MTDAEVIAVIREFGLGSTPPFAREIVRLRKRVAALEQSLGILLRACEAGAYVGRSSDAVLQARALLEPTP